MVALVDYKRISWNCVRVKVVGVEEIDEFGMSLGSIGRGNEANVVGSGM